MILDPDPLVAWYPHFARRHRRVELCDPSAAREACARAATLAGDDPAREPAAIFFAFAEKRRAFPFAWKLMAGYVAFLQAQRTASRSTPRARSSTRSASTCSTGASRGTRCWRGSGRASRHSRDDATPLRIGQEDFDDVMHATAELAEGVIHVLVRRLRAATVSG